MRKTRRQTLNRFEVVTPEDWIRLISRWIVDVVLVACLAFFLAFMLGTRLTVRGGSMSPTLSPSDLVLINRFDGRVFPLNRFDIIAFTNESDDSVSLKRVLALPGETIQIRDSEVMINGKTFDISRYFPNGIASAGLAGEEVTLPRDEYFVIGENADASLDSRFVDVGNIRRDQILGVVWFRLAPFRTIGPVR